MSIIPFTIQVGDTLNFLVSSYRPGWLSSRVVSVLDSGAEGSGFKSSRDAVGQQS